MRLLITRPQPQADQTAAALRACGHEVICAPLTRIEPVSGAVIPAKLYDAVIMTSANAARFVAQHSRLADLRTCPLFAVGHATAAAARTAGFSTVVDCEGDVAAVAGMLLRQFGADRPRHCLYLAGEARAGDLPELLRGSAITIDTVVVYRAAAVDALPASVWAAFRAGMVQGVLHYSPRAARLFVSDARRAGMQREAFAVIHYCLSDNVAAPLAGAGASAIRIANHPDEQSLLQAVDI